MKTFYFTPGQKQEILSVVDDLTHKAALELGFAVGCRVSEALELTVEDVDF